MGIGVSVFLLAVGAILAFAVDFQTSGIDINTVGVILMIVGAVGLLFSFMLWDRLGFGTGAGSHRRTYVRDSVDDGDYVVAERPVARTTRRVVREDF